MLLLTLLSCVAVHPLEGQAICDEVGFGLSSRTLACTDDAVLANQRFESFREQLTCT